VTKGGDSEKKEGIHQRKYLKGGLQLSRKKSFGYLKISSTISLESPVFKPLCRELDSRSLPSYILAFPALIA